MRGSIKRVLGARGYALLNLRRAQSTRPLLPGQLFAMLAARGVNGVLDVAANAGQYGALAGGVGGDPRVVAAERVPVDTLDAVFTGAVEGITAPRVFLEVDT